MRAFMIAIVTASVCAFLGRYAVNEIRNKQQTKNSALRRTFGLSHEEAGHNLVGRDWASQSSKMPLDPSW
jgi:hypothetical protein